MCLGWASGSDGIAAAAPAASAHEPVLPDSDTSVALVGRQLCLVEPSLVELLEVPRTRRQAAYGSKQAVARPAPTDSERGPAQYRGAGAAQLDVSGSALHLAAAEPAERSLQAAGN